MVSDGFEAENETWCSDFLPDASIDWDERLAFLGLSPKKKNTNLFHELRDTKENTIGFFPCFLHPKQWQKEISFVSESSCITVIYRPVEQIIDSITRHGVKKIYLSKKGFAKMFALRKFNKSLADLQNSVKNAYIDYYLAMLELIERNKYNFHLINSSNFTKEFPSLVEHINKKHGLNLKSKVEYYDEDLFNKMKEIDVYRDEGLNKIHSYFSSK